MTIWKFTDLFNFELKTFFVKIIFFGALLYLDRWSVV